MNESVFTLTKELEDFLSKLPESGELNDEMLEQYVALEEKLNEKQKATIEFHKHTTSQIKIIDEEIDRLKRLKNNKESLQGRLEMLLDYGMKKRNISKVDFGTCSAKYRKNPPRVEVYDDTIIPEDYKEIREVTKIDKVKLKLDLRNGKEIEGARIVQDEKLKIN